MFEWSIKITSNLKHEKSNFLNKQKLAHSEQLKPI